MGFHEVMTNEQLYSRNLSSVNSFKLSFLFQGRCLLGYTRSYSVQRCCLGWEMPPPPLYVWKFQCTFTSTHHLLHPPLTCTRLICHCCEHSNFERNFLQYHLLGDYLLLILWNVWQNYRLKAYSRQGPLLQALVCCRGPSQSAPYGPWGGGWVQVLFRVCVPNPQETLHSLQNPQRENPPSTPR